MSRLSLTFFLDDSPRRFCLVKYPQQPGIGASPEKAFRIRSGDRHARLLPSPQGRLSHVLSERTVGFTGVRLHLPDNLFPGTGIERPGGGPDPVLFGNPRASPVLHALQLGEQGPEQLELPWIAHLAVGPQSLDLRQEEVLGIR